LRSKEIAESSSLHKINNSASKEGPCKPRGRKKADDIEYLKAGYDELECKKVAVQRASMEGVPFK